MWNTKFKAARARSQGPDSAHLLKFSPRMPRVLPLSPLCSPIVVIWGFHCCWSRLTIRVTCECPQCQICQLPTSESQHAWQFWKDLSKLLHLDSCYTAITVSLASQQQGPWFTSLGLRDWSRFGHLYKLAHTMWLLGKTAMKCLLSEELQMPSRHLDTFGTCKMCSPEWRTRESI